MLEYLTLRNLSLLISQTAASSIIGLLVIGEGFPLAKHQRSGSAARLLVSSPPAVREIWSPSGAISAGSDTTHRPR